VKALTVRPPYAGQIVSGRKLVENRVRPTYYRGKILIHAGAAVHDHFKEIASTVTDPMGAIVGEVTILGSHSAHGCTRTDCRDLGGFRPGSAEVDFKDGPLHHWVLSDPVQYREPVPASGALGYWVPPESVMERVRVQRRLLHD